MTDHFFKKSNIFFSFVISAGVPSPKPRPQQPMQSSPIDPISVDSIVESGVSHDMGSYSPIASSPSRVNNRSGIPTVIADPKGVELDNAGRVRCNFKNIFLFCSFFKKKK